nr:MAG TPA_asm: hypothetical protein [Caudoviricetes sp.]
MYSSPYLTSDILLLWLPCDYYYIHIGLDCNRQND